VEEELKIKISRMYYLSDMSKKDIAENLGISRFRVSRLLVQARDEGLVRIEIKEPVTTSVHVEEQLEKHFNLNHAIVVHPSDTSSLSIMHAIGHAAANRLIDLVKDNDVFGITWGATVNEVVESLPSRLSPKIQVIQLIGGLNQMSLSMNPIDLVRRVAEIYDSPGYVLYAPAIVRNPLTREALLSEQGICQTVALFDSVNVSISGVGAFSTRTLSNLLKAGNITEEEIRQLKEMRAVGDIYGHFIDIEGNVCNTNLEKYMIGLSIEQIKKVKYSIGVAGGTHKSIAILAALRGGLINVLVTDHDTAQDILEKDDILFT
jgi:DNA-binding transcriptional regulator LsrR (DeoR family)